MRATGPPPAWEIILAISERHPGFAGEIGAAGTGDTTGPFRCRRPGAGSGEIFASVPPSRSEGEDGADEVVNGPGKLTLRAELLADADKHQGLDGGVPGNGFHDRPSVAEAAAGSR